MTAEERISDITKHLHAAERHTKLLHKSLSDGLAEHGALIGLSDDQVTALGGGTPKTEPPAE
jgi:hypothetical protein